MEDNVKGLIRTCCIVLIISIGLSVVYSAKRPYIYLIDNYDYHYPPPPATAEGAHYLHQQQQRRSNRDRADDGRFSVDSGNSGNDYNNKFFHPFIFHDTHRNGEVTGDDHHTENFMDETLQLPPPPLQKRTGSSGSSSSGGSKKKQKGGDDVRKSVKKASQKNVETEKKESTGVESSFPFPIPWDWNVRMAEMNKKAKKNDEDRRFKLPRLPTLPTIEFQFSAETEPGRKSRSHIPSRSQSSIAKQIQFADIISPETLSFISKLQMLNVTKLAAGNGGVISVGGAGANSGSEETNAYNPNLGTPLLSGDFLNVQSTKPLIIPKESSRNPTKEEIEAYHKLKHKFNKPAASSEKESAEEDDEQEVEDDEAEDDTSNAEKDSQQQSEEEQEIGSKSKESKESKEDDLDEREQDQDREQEQDDEKEPEPSGEKDQDDDREPDPSGEKEQDEEKEPEQSVEKEHSDESLDVSDEETVLNDSPLRTKKKTRRPVVTQITRPSSTFALDPTAYQSITRHNSSTSHSSASNYNNLFEPAAVENPDPNGGTNAKPVIILLNVPKPTELKGDTGSFGTDFLYGDEDKKAEKKKKKEEKKKKKKAKLAAKKKKKKKKKNGWWPKPTQRPNKKADIINRLTKVHSNVQEIFQTFKGVISDYVINRPHVGVEFIHTNRNTPPPHRARPPPKDDDDDDDDDGGKGKSGEMEHDREKSDDRKLRLPGGSSASFEDFDDNQYVAVGGKPTIWNPSEWSFSYPPANDAETATTLSKRFQECQNSGGGTECSTTIMDGSVNYNPPEPLYMESVVSSESGEKPPPRPPFREQPPPRISTGGSEKVWVKTWDKDKTGLPLPIDSSELNKN